MFNNKKHEVLTDDVDLYILFGDIGGWDVKGGQLSGGEMLDCVPQHRDPHPTAFHDLDAPRRA